MNKKVGRLSGVSCFANLTTYLDGETCTQDHTVQTFTVKIRSMNIVTDETIKRILQTKLEVLKVIEEESVTYVR